MPKLLPPIRPLACQRLELLCDPGTLEVIAPAAESANVVAAFGQVAGAPIACYAQDSSIAGGSVGLAEAGLMTQVLRRSRQAGIPVVGFLESAGARLQDGAAALAGFGRIFSENVALSGRAPQISVITGTAAGGGCYSPALTDFVVMRNGSSMFLTGPKIVKHALGEEVSASELGGVGVHERNGVCDFVVSSDVEAVMLVRELLGYLPQNAHTSPRITDSEPPRGDGDPAAPIPDRSRSFYDVREVIRRLVDGGCLLEVAPRWARNLVVGFARLEGHPVAVIANQARHLGGIIDVAGSQKGAKFVRTCDAFGLPLLVLVDTPGFMPGTRQEEAGVIRHGAELVRAFAAARVPRATVILRKAFGGAFITMNSKDLGATVALSWPNAEIGIMSADAAVEIIHGRELAGAASRRRRAEYLARRYAEEHLSAQAALRQGAIDALIEPRETRERVADVLLGPRGPVAPLPYDASRAPDAE
ncbi:MAG: acyl-CoA carboxylase subunit beta [Solirubrobacteraceae bacterium]